MQHTIYTNDYNTLRRAQSTGPPFYNTPILFVYLRTCPTDARKSTHGHHHQRKAARTFSPFFVRPLPTDHDFLSLRLLCLDCAGLHVMWEASLGQLRIHLNQELVTSPTPSHSLPVETLGALINLAATGPLAVDDILNYIYSYTGWNACNFYPPHIEPSPRLL